MNEDTGKRSYLSKGCQECYKDYLLMKTTSDDNFNLFKKWHETNDPSYRDQIILSNIKLVYYISSKTIFQDVSMDSDDLLQIGIIGLMKAVDSYDYTKKYAFSTYAAKLIKNEIYMKFRKMKYLSNIMSLDAPFYNTDNDPEEIYLIDILEDQNGDFEKDIMHATMISLLESALDCLTEKEKNIIIDRFGLCGHKALKQREAAEKYECSQAMICRHIQKALHKMKINLLSKL